MRHAGRMMTSSLTTLTQFRTSVYRSFGRRRDALFELLESLVTARPVPSPVHLSLEPTHRRAVVGGACMRPWFGARCAPRNSHGCWPASPWCRGSRSTRWIPAAGPAAMPRPAPIVASTTIRLATPRGNRSWRAGPTNGWPNWASPVLLQEGLDGSDRRAPGASHGER
jgi:hypothetical protein